MKYCAEHKDQRKDAFLAAITTDCPYCRIAELEQQLADERKAAGYWMEQSCKDHNKAEKLELLLSRYQGGVEVEGVVDGVAIGNEYDLYLELDNYLPQDVFCEGQRVRVLVLKGGSDG